MITRHIADLLYHHECVIVPGLGGFIKANIPARIIHTSHEFFPPSGTLAFNSGLAANDGLLANHIASVQNTSYREALYEIKKWVEICLDAIHKGEKVTLQGIGELFMNASGRLEFKPSQEINFNLDAFGLPVFIGKTAGQQTVVVPEIQSSKYRDRNSKLRRLVPETLKWAAVLAPFIAFVLWGSVNGNMIDNYVHNYTGIFSWVRSTPGKTVNDKATPAPARSNELPKQVIQSPASILDAENISFEPGAVSNAELDKIKISTKSEAVNPAEIPADQHFFVIGGAFRDQHNALKLIGELREQGYPAAIIDTTPGGLYIVSMKGFNSYDEAQQQLDEVKKSGFASSWILKKNRG